MLPLSVLTAITERQMKLQYRLIEHQQCKHNGALTRNKPLLTVKLSRNLALTVFKRRKRECGKGGGAESQYIFLTLVLKVILEMRHAHYIKYIRFYYMMLNTTFNNISIIQWLSVLLVEGTG